MENRNRSLAIAVILIVIICLCSSCGYGLWQFGSLRSWIEDTFQQDFAQLQGDGTVIEGEETPSGQVAEETVLATPPSDSLDEVTPTSPTISEFIFTPFGYFQIVHGDGMSWIYYVGFVYDSNLEPVEGAEVTASLTHPDGTKDTQSAMTDALGSAEINYDIFTYGDYDLTVDNVTLAGFPYAPNTFDAFTAFSINVNVNEIRHAPTGLFVDFYNEFNQAFVDQDVDFLVDNLNPAVIDRYGEPLCRQYIESVIDKPIEIQVLEALEFGEWTWMPEGESVQIPGTYTLNIDVGQPGGSSTPQQTHLALDPMLLKPTWLTYCEPE